MKPTASQTVPLCAIAIEQDRDVLRARCLARQLAESVGVTYDDRACFAAAVCEIVRAVSKSGPGGRIQFALEHLRNGQWLIARVTGHGAGLRHLVAIADGDAPPVDADAGVAVARQLVERFEVYTEADETTVEVGHPVPASTEPIDPGDAARIMSALTEQTAIDPVAEGQRQNRELAWALTAERRSRAQIDRLNSELEATNRGVMALYAELDDRAEDLKRASEHKSRFLSDVSHELRTPMTAIMNLTRLLLDHTDGPLSEEQEHQVTLIRQSVQTVTELVNDLLDIARIEAGHTALRYRAVTVRELLGAIRGIIRPLLTSDAVNLVFDDDEADTVLETDDSRVAQILRNLLSNAIKFTERGEIRVSATRETGDVIRFDVRDTGIGIAAVDQERIFDEFTQIDSHLQRRVHGSGLGLRLARTLATLLGGRIELVSAPRRGSTFSLILPRRHPGWVTQSVPNDEAQCEVTVP